MLPRTPTWWAWQSLTACEASGSWRSSGTLHTWNIKFTQLHSERACCLTKSAAGMAKIRLLFSPRGCYFVWRFSLEMLVKYLGILERLEARGRPSFHSDLDDQDPPEQNSFALFTHLLSSFRKKDRRGGWGTNKHTLGLWTCPLKGWGHAFCPLHWVLSENTVTSVHWKLQLPWEYSGDLLPRDWGIIKEKTLLFATRQGVSYCVLAFILLW